MVRAAHRRANGSILLVTECSTTEVQAAIEIAAADGSQAFVPPPLYYLLPEEADIKFCADLAEHSPLPIILYHIPKPTENRLSGGGCGLSPHLANVIGLKDIPVSTDDDVEVLGIRLASVLEPLMKMAEASRKVRRNS